MASYRAVSISELTPGSVLATPVFDEHLFKLLDAGTKLDQYLIDRLRVLGIAEVTVDSSVEHLVSHPAENEHTEGVLRQDRIALRSVPVKSCSKCRTSIVLETPAPNSKASIWCCKSCGSLYVARNDKDQERQGVLRIDPAEKNPFLLTSPTAIPQEYIQRLSKSQPTEQHSGVERRTHKRYDIAVPVVALPLGSDFRVIGEPMQMVTANVSLGGAALIHTRFIDASNLALDYALAGVRLQVVLKVLRVKSLGLVYEVAGEFIAQLVYESE